MSANMLMTQMAQPVTAVYETVSAAPQYASPVTYAAPMVNTIAAAPVYSTVSAPVTTMAAPMAQYVSQAPTYTTMAAPTVTTTMASPLTGTIMNYGGSVSAPITMAPAAINTSTIIAAPAAQPVTTMMPSTQAVSYVQQQQPVTTVMQAPQVVQAATQVAYQTTAAPSYVQQPVAYTPQTMQMAAPQAMMMPAPASLTAGIPNPDQIVAQKTAYSAALDKQLKDGMETIQKENEIEKSMIKFTADKQLALMQMQVEEQCNEKIAVLDEQATFRQCELRKAFVERKIQLDNQANGLVMDYQMKAVQTELTQKQYAFQQTYVTAENALAAQYNQEVAKAQTGTTYAVPSQAVPQAAPAAVVKPVKA